MTRRAALGDVWLSIVLGLGTAIAYAGALENSFVNFDDGEYVFDNPMVRKGLSAPSVTWAFRTWEQGNWHPLTWLSLEADSQLFGLNPRAFHAMNVALHAANTVLLFWVVRLMTGLAWRSAWVAAFFALHPLHVESVAWVAERKDVLSTFFLFLCLLAWLSQVRRPAVWKYGLAVALFAFSLMAKAMGVTLPLVLLLLDYWPLARWRGAAGPGRRPASGTWLLVEKLPFFMLSAGAAVVAVLAQAQVGAMDYGRSLPSAARLLTVPVNYLTYLARTFWPVDLAVLYPHAGADVPLWQSLAAAAALALITALALWARAERPYLVFGWCWFVITLLPVIGLVQIGAQATADRYMYVPMVGLLIGLCWAFCDLAGERGWRPAAQGAALTIGLVSCAALTTRQVAVWRNGVTLWGHALTVTAPSVWGCNQLGQALAGQGREDQAEPCFRAALEIDPAAFAPNANLGLNLLRQGRPAEAAPYLLAALESRPNDPLLLERLGMVEEMRGNLEAAIGYYESAAAQRSTGAPRIRRHIHRLRAQ